jgi:hypothetical protein
MTGPHKEDRVIVTLGDAVDTGESEDRQAHGWVVEWDEEAGMARIRLEDDSVVEVTLGAVEVL